MTFCTISNMDSEKKGHAKHILSCCLTTLLIRLQLEYSAHVWDPSTKHKTRQLENIQRRASRLNTSSYDTGSSTSAMLDDKYRASGVPSKVKLALRNGAISCAPGVQRKCSPGTYAVYFSSDLTAGWKTLEPVYVSSTKLFPT